MSAFEIVCKSSLMTYTDMIEYNIFDDTKVPLLHCFPSISWLKSGDIITTGQYLNYQTFINIQIRPLFKNYFHSVDIDLRDTGEERKKFCVRGY